MYNAVSGETVTYTYDSLNRLATAGGTGWGEAYTFDPYGNLTTKQVTSGTGPSLSVTVNQSYNKITSVYGQSYDANGNTLDSNMTAYDVENHLIGAGWNFGAPAVDYAYDAQGKRSFLWTAGTFDPWGGNATNYSVVMYSPSGQKLGTYLISVCNQGANNTTSLTICSALSTSDRYFGGRRLAVMDQLGSAGTYYPWGEAKGSTNPQDAWSYAKYWRDSISGLDYANERYYSNQYGRFMTSDPAGFKAARPQNPGTWNRYAYTAGDPVNGNDPSGLDGYSGDFGGSYEVGVDWGYCDSVCVEQESFTSIGTYAGPTAQDIVCESLILSFAQDGGAWNPSCGNVPVIPVQSNPTPQCPLVAPTGNYTVAPGVDAMFAPDMAALIDAAFAVLNQEGVVPMITSGFRTAASQLAQQNSPYGHAQVSWHQVGEAIDINSKVSTSVFQEIVDAMTAEGLTWGGTFRHKDPVHFQDARAGTSPNAALVAACAKEHP